MGGLGAELGLWLGLGFENVEDRDILGINESGLSQKENLYFMMVCTYKLGFLETKLGCI